MAVDPQKLFNEVRNRHKVTGYRNLELNALEQRIFHSLHELIKHFGVGIFRIPQIPTPLLEFCQRLQYVITEYERVQPLRESDVVEIAQETWRTVLQDYGSAIDSLLIECNQ